MKSNLLLSILLVSAAATAGEATRATAKQESGASEKFSVTPVFASTVFSSSKAARAALRKAPELIVGSDVKDTAGCLYTVAARDSKLVLIPVVFNGKRICAANK